MDWRGCSEVEVIPGKVSGVPLVRGRRLPAQTILDNFNAGVSDVEIADLFEVSLATVRAVIDYAREHHEPSAV